MGGLYLYSARARSGDRSVQFRRIRSGRRGKQLHRFQSVPQPDAALCREGSAEVAVESQPGHLGAVSAIIVHRPHRLGGVAVRTVQRRLQQRVITIDAAVDDADRWRVSACRFQPANEFLDPLRLLHSVAPSQELRGIVWSAKLSEIVQNIDGGPELLHGGLEENDSPVPESETLPSNLQSYDLGEGTQTFDLAPVPTAQPYLPPHGLPGARELLRRIGPQRLLIPTGRSN